jgi:SAM-dependent methyltransferase
MDDALEATRKAERSHFWFRGFRHFVTPILDRAAAGRRDLRLLDCGCGTGHNLRLLQRYGRACGFDLTASGLAHARDARALIARADISRIPFRSATFDVVTCFDVMQYAVDDQAAMIEIVRVLRPGGTLVVTAAAMQVLRGGHAAFWPEVRRYDRKRLRRISEGAGLQILRLSYLFGTLFPMVLAARVASRLSNGDVSRATARPVSTAARPLEDWEMRVPPAAVNVPLAWLVAAEAALSPHVALPFGSSLLLVARKP